METRNFDLILPVTIDPSFTYEPSSKAGKLLLKWNWKQIHELRKGVSTSEKVLLNMFSELMYLKKLHHICTNILQAVVFKKNKKNKWN